jgi:hypothetical protein
MLKRSTPALAALLLTLPLVSCGGGSKTPTELTNDGAAALGSGDYTGALSNYREALAGLTREDPDYLRAKMGEVEALIHVNAEEATTTFLGLGSLVDENHFATVASKMTSAGEYQEAIKVLDAGVQAYGESPKLVAMLQKVKEEAEDAGDEGALKALEGLGYL